MPTSIVAGSFYTPPVMGKRSFPTPPPISLPASAVVIFLVIIILTGVRENLNIVSICIYLTAKVVEIFSQVWHTHSYIF